MPEKKKKMTLRTLEAKIATLIESIESIEDTESHIRIAAPVDKPMMLYFYTGYEYPERE